MPNEVRPTFERAAKHIVVNLWEKLTPEQQQRISALNTEASTFARKSQELRNQALDIILPPVVSLA